MRAAISIFILLSISTLAFICFSSSEKEITEISKPVINSSSPQAPSYNGWDDRFYIGAMNDDDDYYYTGADHWSQIDRMGFTLWHKYLGGEHITNPKRWYPSGGVPRVSNDLLIVPVSDYKTEVDSEISRIFRHTGRKLIVMRPKIEWLCYGQRSDYRCVDSANLEDRSLWFYTFQSPAHVGRDVPDDTYLKGKYVRFCRTENSTNRGNWVDHEGTVVSRLKANTEQCRRIIDNNSVNNQWQGDSECDWIIKPRIRIDSAFAHANPETPVCSIKVIAQDSFTVLKKVIIKAKDFLVDGNRKQFYNGRYIEEFNFEEPNVNLIIHGDWLGTDTDGKWGYRARGNHYLDQNSDNHADIQVYWYGSCDMWIDYVRVDNDVADELFKGIRDQWIEDEVSLIGMKTVNGEYPILRYYLEAAEFNNIPCMAYVNHKIDSISGGHLGLIQDMTNSLSSHVPWDDRSRLENADFLYNEYLQKVGFKQIFAESYPMTACYTTSQSSQNISKIPNTLPIHTGTNVLASAVSPSEYDSWLQDNLNHKPYVLEGGNYNVKCTSPECSGTSGGDLYQDLGNFRNRLQLCNALSRTASIPFIFMPQAHQWFKPGEVRREPTNEELNMMANVAVSYGVKGLMYFEFPTWYNSPCEYGTGLSTGWASSLREGNYYGETTPKWEVMKSIVDRLSNIWGPYLLSFDNTQTISFIFDIESERNELINSSYFKNVVTYKYGQGFQPLCPDNPQLISGMTYECYNQRYVQAATFKSLSDPGAKYFMIVNRRCSPYIDESSEDKRGGKRYIILFFHPNHPEFDGHDLWNIYELGISSPVPIQFDKRSGAPIVLGDFLPGEGKLYKIVPAE